MVPSLLQKENTLYSEENIVPLDSDCLSSACSSKCVCQTLSCYTGYLEKILDTDTSQLLGSCPDLSELAELRFSSTHPGQGTQAFIWAVPPLPAALAEGADAD